MMVLILFPGIPESVANGMILCCEAIILLALVLYARFYQKMWKEHDRAAQQAH